MASRNNRLRSDHTPIKYSWSPVGKTSPKLSDFLREEYSSTISENIDKKPGKRADSKTPEILTTTELISVVGQIWEYASRPLSSFGRKNEVVVSNVDVQENGVSTSSVTRAEYYSVDLRTASHSSSKVKPAFDFMKVTEKLAVFEEKYTHTSFWRLLQGGTTRHKEPWSKHGLTSIEIACELEGMYGWTKQTAFSGLKSQNEVTEAEMNASEYCWSGDKSSHGTSLVSSAADWVIKSHHFPSLNEAKSELITRPSLYSDYFLAANLEQDATISRTSVSDLCKEYHLGSLVNGASDDSEQNTDDNQLPDSKTKQCEDLVVAEDSTKKELLSQEFQKPQLSFARQEHAFAGAFAGIFVSFCLHPVDTLKTVVQSCHADQKSLLYIGRSLVAERGMTGLYRGIATNIASSAPISAIYTFTYESVKGALLPHLPKEYHSFAHCVAGGCASVATSFVFTPSERIKQQMQVGSHYSNCWNALVGVLQNGGLRSLYNGWGAVLCRNVPHSIIKFYTYESLKRLTSSSPSDSTQPSTLQTLVCGGVAGSTAAFFTTPFDVVKTRMQTQVPGAINQYNSVFHALVEIGKNKGLKGLYCGLTPRLVMYVSQGALFFASYEFFIKFLSLETPQHETERIKYGKHKEDNSPLIPSALPQSTSPTNLHGLHSS